MTTRFLFMDEKYADRAAPPCTQITTLTGILIPASAHRNFRARFYGLVSNATGEKEGIVRPFPLIHAAELLPEADDEARFAFFRGLVSLVLELELQIYRVGYRATPAMLSTYGNETNVLGLCFMSMLCCLETELANSAIWPVMEIDRSSPIQDRQFAGLVQNLDYLTSRFGSASMTLSNDNLGEVLYTTKRSAHGALVDCVAYLLHLAFLKSIGQPQTHFKGMLAEVGSGLGKAVAFNEVIEMKFEGPPQGYVATGPLRYAVKITPAN